LVELNIKNIFLFGHSFGMVQATLLSMILLSLKDEIYGTKNKFFGLDLDIIDEFSPKKFSNFNFNVVGTGGFPLFNDNNFEELIKNINYIHILIGYENMYGDILIDCYSNEIKECDTLEIKDFYLFTTDNIKKFKGNTEFQGYFKKNDAILKLIDIESENNPILCKDFHGFIYYYSVLTPFFLLEDMTEEKKDDGNDDETVSLPYDDAEQEERDNLLKEDMTEEEKQKFEDEKREKREKQIKKNKEELEKQTKIIEEELERKRIRREQRLKIKKIKKRRKT
jgi:hypothetical protein